jgi:hypothetical protein
MKFESMLFLLEFIDIAIMSDIMYGYYKLKKRNAL